MAKNRRYEDYERMQVLTVAIPRQMREAIDRLVEVDCFFSSRSEFIRDAIRKRFNDMESLGQKLECILNDPGLIRIPNGDGTYNEVELVRRLE